MIKQTLIFILLLSLAGCSSITQTTTAPASTEPTPKLTWSERHSQLSSLKQFGLNGKIAVITNKDSGSANLAWSEQSGRYAISLTGPLGSHATRLNGQPGRVTLQDSDGKRYTANSPEQLIAKGWGYQLPISSMVYWVRGIPAPGSQASTHFDGAARLQSLKQLGYSINYSDYASYGHYELPTRINISSAAMRVKLVIYQWQVG